MDERNEIGVLEEGGSLGRRQGTAANIGQTEIAEQVNDRGHVERRRRLGVTGAAASAGTGRRNGRGGGQRHLRKFRLEAERADRRGRRIVKVHAVLVLGRSETIHVYMG